MALSYQQEFLDTFIKDAGILVEKDWYEIQHNSDVLKLDPDWDMYRKLELEGLLYIFTCRDSGKLVGYFTVFIIPNLHCKGNTRAVNDSIFMEKSYRKGFTGIRLIKFAESCIKKDGHKTLTIATTEINPIDSIIYRLGYSKVSTSFEKEL